MNERIKKIGKQAGFAFIEDSVYGQRWYSGKCGMDAEEFEKLVELIVHECLKIVNRKEYSYHEADPLWETAELIKQHFGVAL
jgi:hypothetical protein